MDRRSLTRYAWLSIAAAILTIGLKYGAYLVTNSVGLLSDAIESVVNLVAAIVALIVLGIAARPPDESHEYGHDKAEFFSSGVEGGLIVVAALSIAGAAIDRLLNPQAIEQVGIGLGISLGASLVNFGVAQILLRAGRAHASITLEADAHHLMTDVWTSIGVVVGIAAVWLSGWLWLDPVIALVVAANIVWTGVSLLRRSVGGLMDIAWPVKERAAMQQILDRYVAEESVQFHALRTRQSGARSFMSVHVLVPGDWTVRRGHTLLEQLEADIRAAVPHVHVFTHLEPVDDPISWADARLDRVEEQTELRGQQGEVRGQRSDFIADHGYAVMSDYCLLIANTQKGHTVV